MADVKWKVDSTGPSYILDLDDGTAFHLTGSADSSWSVSHNGTLELTESTTGTNSRIFSAWFHAKGRLPG